MTCNTCNKELSEEFFGAYQDRRDGKTFGKIRRRKKCKYCRSQETSARYANNPILRRKTNEIARTSRLRKLYKITDQEFESLSVKQNKSCAICLKQSDQRLNIDHCHITGSVRGLLCWNCNIGLGYFKDNIEFLDKAIKYLKGI